MKIKSFETDNNLFKSLSFPSDKRVLLMCGKGSDVLLDLMRVTVGDADGKEAARSSGALYADVEAFGKSYNVCCILNADGIGKHRIGVGCEPGNSSDALARSEEYARGISALNVGGNVFSASTRVRCADELLSESDRIQSELRSFVRSARTDIERGNGRPVFVYGAFDRIDEAESRRRIVGELLSIGRQVFVSVASISAVGELTYDPMDGCCVVSM